MRLLTAIVLLLWTVCYGRCLAEQYGGNQTEETTWCEQQCCQHEKSEIPPPSPSSLCEVCEFIKSGVVLTSDGMDLDVPIFYCLPIEEPNWFNERALKLVDDEKGAVVTSADPPLVARMCEWMARTAAPVRGPNSQA